MRATTPITIAEGYALHPRSSDSITDYAGILDDEPQTICTSEDIDPGDSAAHDVTE